ncbi:MBL fold metallo-hydrolase [Rubrivirga sp.]|uniref:MBL fold metallo-hydrolase n=1 Tax=Rubrivirga sp. TaxID=1885344 RepID=UPI003B52A930
MSLSRKLIAGASLAGAAAGGALLAARLPVFGAAPVGDRLDRMRRSPQWDGAAFRNPLPMRSGGSPGMIWEWLFGDTAEREPSAPVPTVARARADFDAPQDLRLTWLGHGTTLVEIEGRRLLIDPVFSRNASPGPLFGVARFFEPPLPLAEVPALDAVVLTHDHYDHLDAAAVRRLAPSVPRWVCPLGVGAHLERWGVPADRITEHDWWDETDVAGLRLVCTPARHFSGRFLDDRNRTLWSGWAILGAERRLYATGDGGFGPHFSEVGDRLGPFDATLAEVGAYNADWADVHMGPEQAVQAVRDARGGLLVPVHWGTFNLSFHGWTEPAERVIVAAEAAGVPLAVPRPGESVEPASPPTAERWWPEVRWQTADQAPVVSSGLG